MSLTPQILQAQVKHILGKMSGGMAPIQGQHLGTIAFGVHSLFPWNGPEEIMVEGSRFLVRSCASQLSIREALVEERKADLGLVIVTRLTESQVGEDVLARLVRCRLESKSLALVLRDTLQAELVEPRLAKMTELVQLALSLLETSGGERAEVAPEGLVSESLVWEIVLTRFLKFESRQPELEGLIAWCKEDQGIGAYRSMSSALKEALLSHLENERGIVQCSGVFKLLEERGPLWPLIIGLVFEGLVQMPEGQEERELWVRLEQYVGRKHSMSLAEMRRFGKEWGRAASDVLSEIYCQGQTALAQGIVQEADRILATELLGRDIFLYCPWSEKGWLKNLGQAGSLLEQGLSLIDCSPESSLGGGKERDLESRAQLERQIEQVLLRLSQHSLVKEKLKSGESRHRRVLMASRLLRFLWARFTNFSAGQVSSNQFPTGSALGTRGVALQAERYLQEGSFVDWARAEIAQGDSEPHLSKALLAINSVVSKERARENREFAESLQFALSPQGKGGAIAGRFPGGNLLLIEDVLKDLVAPLVKEQKSVLLLIVDGLSLSVFWELVDDFPRHGFELVGFGPSLQGTRAVGCLAGLALLPSVTEVSRRALCAGQIVASRSSAEDTLFAENEALRAVCKPKYPPLLFSKDRLSQPSSKTISPEVREALSDPSRRVVGCIINAVDDNLQKGEQQSEQWSVERIRPLGELLNLASHSGRTVIVAADHGHVIERGSEFRRYEHGERYRLLDAEASGSNQGLAADELLFTGERVVVPGNKVICPWAENVRYIASKKHGYHGGVSMQEMLVPLAVLLPQHEALRLGGNVEVANAQAAGLRLLPPLEPEWWFESPTLSEAGDKGRIAGEGRPKPGRRGQGGAATLGAAGGPSLGEQLPLAGITQPLIRQGEHSVSSDNLFERLTESPVYQRQLERVGRSAPDQGRQREFIGVLLGRSGKVLKVSLAQKLSLSSLQIDGFIASMRRLLNVEGFQVLSCNEVSGDVELNIQLLRQQFSLSPHRPQLSGKNEG